MNNCWNNVLFHSSARTSKISERCISRNKIKIYDLLISKTIIHRAVNTRSENFMNNLTMIPASKIEIHTTSFCLNRNLCKSHPN